ncbi:MAG: hypothetical protein GY948_05335 [Alphaproteobacteria bacterium]|nr:hypothetical protein [Alphaproteobacteria bacterium]
MPLHNADALRQQPLPWGKYEVAVSASDHHTLTRREFGDTPEEATRSASGLHWLM